LTFTFTYFWKQLQSTFYFMLQFLQWTILRMLWVKGAFSLYSSIPAWAPKRSWKISHGVLESPGKVLDFFQWKSGNPAGSIWSWSMCVTVCFRTCQVQAHTRWSVTLTVRQHAFLPTNSSLLTASCRCIRRSYLRARSTLLPSIGWYRQLSDFVSANCN